MLLALRKPTSGTIRMFGSDPYHAIKSGKVGAMLQSGGLMPEVTVRELVTLVAGLHPRPVPVATTLRRAGIEEVADQRVDRLSGGQTQRVRFALAIAGESDLIVLDEPTTAMDVETRQRFWAQMKEEVAEGKTLLFATHYLEEADQAADRILVINRGRLLADGTPAEIKSRAGAKQLSFRLRAACTSRSCSACPAWSAWTMHGRHGAHPDQRLRQDAVRGAGRRLPAQRHRGVRPRPRAGVPRDHGGRRPGGRRADHQAATAAKQTARSAR